MSSAALCVRFVALAGKLQVPESQLAGIEKMSEVPASEWPSPRASKTIRVPAKRAWPNVHPGGCAITSVTCLAAGETLVDAGTV